MMLIWQYLDSIISGVEMFQLQDGAVYIKIK